MVRRGAIKYFRHLPSGEEMLSDLEKDPGETVNRIAEESYARLAASMRNELDAILRPGTARPVDFKASGAR